MPDLLTVEGLGAGYGAVQVLRDDRPVEVIHPEKRQYLGGQVMTEAAIDAGLIWLAVAGVIASVIAAFYYLRIVYLMYFGEPAEALDGRHVPRALDSVR